MVVHFILTVTSNIITLKFKYVYAVYTFYSSTYTL